GNLDERTASLDDAAGETDEIADDAAAERDHVVAALDPFTDQPFGEPREAVPAFRAFACGEHEGGKGDAFSAERHAEAREIGFCDICIGDDHRARPLEKRRDVAADAGQEAVADEDRVAAGAKVDGQAFHVASASSIARTVCSCGLLAELTRRCASA